MCCLKKNERKFHDWMEAQNEEEKARVWARIETQLKEEEKQQEEGEKEKNKTLR